MKDITRNHAIAQLYNCHGIIVLGLFYRCSNFLNIRVEILEKRLENYYVKPQIVFVEFKFNRIQPAMHHMRVREIVKPINFLYYCAQCGVKQHKAIICSAAKRDCTDCYLSKVTAFASLSRAEYSSAQRG